MRDGNIAAIDEGLPDSAWVAQKLGRPVVKAFNNIFFKSLDEKGTPPSTAGRVALPIAGDPPSARKVVMELVDRLGFDPIDAGPLSESWRQQPGTPGYCMDLDKAALTEALKDADPACIRENRSKADENAKRVVAKMKETRHRREVTPVLASWTARSAARPVRRIRPSPCISRRS